MMSKISASYAAAILWDMDGTLADSEGAHYETMKETLASLGVHAIEDAPDFTGQSETEVFAYFQHRFGLTFSAEKWDEYRNHIFLRKAPSIQPRKGALELFDQFAQAGVLQAIVSNSNRLLVEATKAALSLSATDIPTITRSDVTCGKPHPEPYLLAAHRLGVAPKNCLVIEDSLTGAQAGRSAGMKVLYWPQDIALEAAKNRSLKTPFLPTHDEAMLRSQATQWFHETVNKAL